MTGDDERARAERLEERIEGLAPGPKGEPRPDGGDLAPLVRLAAALQSHSPGPAPAETRARIRRMVLSRVPAAAPRWLDLGRRLRPAYALAAAALVVTLALGTTAASAEASLPGDPLYPLKRGLETARLTLSLTTDGDEDLIAGFADRRMNEIEALSALGRWDDVGVALESYTQTVSGLGEIDAQEAELRLSHHLQVLERLWSQAPESAQPGLMRAVDRAWRGKDEARSRGGRSGPPLETPATGAPDAESQGRKEGKENHQPNRPGDLPPGWQRNLTPTP